MWTNQPFAVKTDETLINNIPSYGMSCKRTIQNGYNGYGYSLIQHKRQEPYTTATKANNKYINKYRNSETQKYTNNQYELETCKLT